MDQEDIAAERRNGEEIAASHSEAFIEEPDAVRKSNGDHYDLLPAGYLTINEHGLILESNIAAASQLGLPRDFLVNQQISSFIFPDDQDTDCLRRSCFSDTGKSQIGKVRMVRDDGTQFWAWVELAKGRDEENGASVCRIAMSDITPLRQAEEALRTSRRQLADIIEFLPDATIAIDKDKRVIIWNRAIEKMTGIPAQEMIGKSGYAYTVPFHGEARPLLVDFALTDWKAIEALYPAVIRAGDSVMGEVFCKSLYDGMGAWVFIKATPLHDSFGNVNGAIEIIRDITEQKQADAYREMGREILQILNEPGDFNSSLQRINITFKEQTGLDAVGIRLQDGDDFPYTAQIGFSEDFLQMENSLIERDQDGAVCRGDGDCVCLACTCGLVISGNTDPANPFFTAGGSFWTNDSSTIPDIPPGEDPRLHPRNQCLSQGFASIALVPIRNDKRIVGLLQFCDRHPGRFSLGTVGHLEGIASHIGSALMRKQAEDEKTRLEAQFLQAQKMESVGRLAGGVAHDFNNMLTVIKGYSQLGLNEVDKTSPLYTKFDEIIKAAERSAELTQQLLAFARKQIITPKVLDLNKTVAGMLNMLKRLIGEQIQLAWYPGANLWPVKMDSSQIDQILANLCVNSQDAIPEIGRIEIETQNCEIDRSYCANHLGFFPGKFVRLSISDNGCGMDKETLAHIFEPFFTTKDLGKGTGLGLATVYGIVKQNNGFINVYSEPDMGTTCTVYLPRYSGEVEQTASESVAESTSPCHETILLVEDETAILIMTTQMLEMQGYRVVAANSPAEALRLAQEHTGKIHMLMTDVVMPEMNGQDLAKILQALHSQLKLLFMSGFTANVIAHHGVLDEGINFIQKPFSLHGLMAKVREVLDT
jgi:PAS domain S-box-containing protein